MNVLFLDYDGVVNTLVLNNEGLGNLLPNGFYSYICSPKDNKVSNTQAVLLVDMLCKKYNLVIVLTTTWRLDFDLAKSALYNSGLSKDIEIVGSTLKSSSGYRGEEISDWLSHNSVNKFIILDDDCDMEPYLANLVKTNTYDGFTFSKYLEACALLDGDINGEE